MNRFKLKKESRNFCVTLISLLSISWVWGLNKDVEARHLQGFLTRVESKNLHLYGQIINESHPLKPKTERTVLKKPASGGGSPCIMAELGWQEAWYELRKWNGLASLLVCYAAWPHEYEREIVSAQRSRPYCTRSITDQNRVEQYGRRAGVTQPSTAHSTINPSV